MLVDVKFDQSDPGMVAMLRLLGNNGKPIQHRKGVYEIDHFNFDHEAGLSAYDLCYPKFTGINCYGVCDNWQQVVASCQELQDDTPYVLSVTPIRKADQPAQGGWRWHKWGPYIGEQEPTTEYIYDEPKVELVYCYHIYLVPPERVA